MSRNRLLGISHFLGLSIVLACMATAMLAQTPAPDNTKINSRDRVDHARTADQQTNRHSDLAITRNIRRTLAADKTLSTYAHNVKIITQHGDVTLKGPVRTEDEKRIVEAKATDVAGAGHVTNQLAVAPAKRTKHKA